MEPTVLAPARRRVALAVALIVALVTLAVACGSPDTTSTEGAPAPEDSRVAPTLLPRKPKPTLSTQLAPTTTTPPPSRTLPDGSPDTTAPTGAGPFAVGLTNLTFTDTTRPSPARGSQAAKTSRSFVVTIRYPASGPANTPEGALDPAKDKGPFPLVVFVHGFNTSAARYDQLLHQLAAAGYVVAAPDFPLTSSALPGPAVEADVANQPGDVTFIISKMLTVNDQPGQLQGTISADKIAVAGHSDGGNTAAAATYNACCADKRIKAAVVMAGEKNFFPDTWGGQSAAVLALHADKDEITSYQNGQELYAKASSPKYFVTVTGGNHQGPFTDGPPMPAVARMTAEFLDGYLKADQSALAKFRGDANQSPFTLQTG